SGLANAWGDFSAQSMGTAEYGDSNTDNPFADQSHSPLEKSSSQSFAQASGDAEDRPFNPFATDEPFIPRETRPVASSPGISGSMSSTDAFASSAGNPEAFQFQQPSPLQQPSADADRVSSPVQKSHDLLAQGLSAHQPGTARLTDDDVAAFNEFMQESATRPASRLNHEHNRTLRPVDAQQALVQSGHFESAAGVYDDLVSDQPAGNSSPVNRSASLSRNDSAASNSTLDQSFRGDSGWKPTQFVHP
ncbi:MAG: hypothetical protein KDA91_15930, partial [Planctomycetaceae bacterium]|nr:hypothetical protein [Planctomycetaceae bacterium]